MKTEWDPRKPGEYPEWARLEERNHYGLPIIDAGHFMGLHYPATVPPSAGSPPVCSCGWTRFRSGDRWIELVEHIQEMGEYGSLHPPR